MNLSKIPISDLLAEVNKRKGEIQTYNFEQELKTIKKTHIKSITTKNCGIEYNLHPYYKNEENLQFVFGVIKNGEFKDFYYNSGLEYDDFCKLIPSCFVECMESTYEFHPPKGYKNTLESALDILKKAGYSKFKDITGTY